MCDPDDEDDEISIVWSVDDVKEQCNWLTDEQARDVLHNLKHKHDACIGINWDVINVKRKHTIWRKINGNSRMLLW